MAMLLWYHILLKLVPVCCFISMFTLVTLGVINLKFLFFPPLHRWDTAGQEKFKCIASAYYRGAEGENNINLILAVTASFTLYSMHMCFLGRYLKTQGGGLGYPLLERRD